MTEQQAKEMIDLLKSIDSNISHIEANTSSTEQRVTDVEVEIKKLSNIMKRKS